MSVLGLNGVYPRSHDSSACLVSDNEILALAEEERFTRSKRAFDQLPVNSIDYCLRSTDTDINDVEAISYGWLGPKLGIKSVLPARLAAELTREIRLLPIEHHEAHAASTFYTSPFSEAAILVVDGQGEEESTSIWYATAETDLTKLASCGTDKSLGYLYGAISSFCGFGSFGAGKVMGLAPYGTPKYLPVLRKIYHNIELPEQAGFDSQDEFFTEFLGKLYALGFTPPSYTTTRNELTLTERTQPVITEVHHNMAASVQALLEEEMLLLAQKAKQLTGSDYLCLAGGVAMNCVSNSVIHNSGIFKDTHVQPGCEDCGISLGSALAVTKQKTTLKTPYLGSSYSDEEIGLYLDSIGVRATRHDDITDVAASLLASGTILGWFQNGFEYGPRALGARSIVASPAQTETRDRVNAIKSRESWRPFGPSVLAEKSPELFERARRSPYMLRSFTIKPEWRSQLAAVTHIDGSTRPQTVDEITNQRYYRMIRSFYNLTGIPAVLNTSFNNYDEPIVATPSDAIRTFYATNLGGLVLGNRLILK